MELLTGNNLELVLLFVAPGFISLKVWGLLNSSPRIRLSESLTEAIIYSSFNAMVSLWLFNLLRSVNLWLAYVVVFIICPIIWPIGIYLLSTKIKFFRTRLTPTAWNHYFNQAEPCFILLHLKNGKMVGGLYGLDSFASSYPEKADLYLETVYKVDESGQFGEKLARSKGFLVNFEEVSTIEFFEVGDVPTVPITPGQAEPALT